MSLRFPFDRQNARNTLYSPILCWLAVIAKNTISFVGVGGEIVFRFGTNFTLKLGSAETDLTRNKYIFLQKITISKSFGAAMNGNEKTSTAKKMSL